MKKIGQTLRGLKMAAGRVSRSLPVAVKAVAVGAGVAAVGGIAQAQTGSAFDVSTLYTGVSAVFVAAATVAGGFLAIKFGAKMVKKAWAWLT